MIPPGSSCAVAGVVRATGHVKCPEAEPVVGAHHPDEASEAHSRLLWRS